MIALLRRRRYGRRLHDDCRALLGLADGRRHYGHELCLTTGIRAGRLYPALTRLEQQGLARTGWSDEAVQPRRWYLLTEAGSREIAAPRATAPADPVGEARDA